MRSFRTVNGVKHEMVEFGGVIFALKGRTDITTATDAKGRVIAAASISGLGSGQAQFRMLHKAGVSFVQDPKQVIFTSNQGKVVKLVESGDADIGFVRTDQIEGMEDKGEALKADFKIIDRLSMVSDGRDFPFDISTDLYPEWNIGVLGHVNWRVQQEVQQALQRIGEEHPAAVAGRYAGWRPALSYMLLRNMQEQLGYIKWDLDSGVPRCIRSSTLYEAIVCPQGFFKKTSLEVAEGCLQMGQTCPEGMQCLCQPCVRGFEYDLIPDQAHKTIVNSSTSNFLPGYTGCHKMSMCATMEQGEVISFQVKDNVGKSAVVSCRWHTNEAAGDMEVATLNYLSRNGSYFYFEIESTRVGTHILEILADGEQVEISPVFIQVIPLDCRKANGQGTEFQPTAQGVCQCSSGKVSIGSRCVSVLETLLPAVLVPVLLIIFAVMYILFRKKWEQADLIWKVKTTELVFSDPPEVLGQGTFGLVVAAEYRGTKVAVKHVLPVLRDTRTFMQRLFDFSAFPIKQGGDLVLDPSVERKFSENTNRNSVGEDMSQTSRNSGEHMNDTLGNSTTRVFMDGASWKDTVSSRYGTVSRQLRSKFIADMRVLSKLRHPCITSVMGAVMDGPEPMLVMELMEHGSLHDLLHNSTVEIEGELVLPILQDVAQGLRFLHAADVPFVHGDIKAQNILVDSRFRAKVADFGLTQKKSIGLFGTPAFMAPELLRGESLPTPASDVYAFAIVLCEIYGRSDPYHGEDLTTVLEEVADAKREEDRRCEIPAACPPEILALIKDCWHRDPNSRPRFSEIDRRLLLLDETGASPLTNIISSYRSTKQRENRDTLLYDVFPKHVVEALSEGRKVEPDVREMASVFFCDIVNFTVLSSKLSAPKISDMLDRLYSHFDELSQTHKVFKVETIGDSYMAITNLAEDQLSDHALRLARFALAARDACSKVMIDEDDPDLGTVKIRIGVHCGPVVGNVVGSRKPKYTLFGDTVNTTSRMESTCIEGRIHMSERFARTLSAQGPAMEIHRRGTIDVKGKGKMRTYWLQGEGQNHRVEPTESVFTFDRAHSGSTAASQVLQSPCSTVPGLNGNGREHFLDSTVSSQQWLDNTTHSMTSNWDIMGVRRSSQIGMFANPTGPLSADSPGHQPTDWMWEGVSDRVGSAQRTGSATSQRATVARQAGGGPPKSGIDQV